MDLYAVIMAGGSGTRFWPLSRKDKPKQFLPIISDKTMIEETVARLNPPLPLSRIFTIANREHSEVIRELLPDFNSENILIEPMARNTAPCLLLATAAIHLRNPNAVMAALPADHLIRDRDRFVKSLTAAADYAADIPDLVTFGIPPTYPSTGYGYIRFADNEPVKAAGDCFYPVREFKEKPDVDLARTFLRSGNYFWNSGMFVWKASAFAAQLEQHAPSLFVFWQRILRALKPKATETIAAIFEEMPSISIDYALMEKSRRVSMCRGDFGWSDVGAWSALSDIWPRDVDNNALRGEAVSIQAENCLLHNPGKLTALIGVKDLIVVNTEDALLICSSQQDQKVKDIVNRLVRDGKKSLL